MTNYQYIKSDSLKIACNHSRYTWGKSSRQATSSDTSCQLDSPCNFLCSCYIQLICLLACVRGMPEGNLSRQQPTVAELAYFEGRCENRPRATASLPDRTVKLQGTSPGKVLIQAHTRTYRQVSECEAITSSVCYYTSHLFAWELAKKE